MKRDGNNESAWQHNIPDYLPDNNASTAAKYDVIIVGAGITGLATALLLQQAGKQCMILESHTVGFGTTSGTTAHLNNFFETPFNQVAKDFGEEGAQKLAKAAREALALLKKNVADLQIDCDLQERDAYLFSLDKKQDKELEDVVDGCNRFGVHMEWTNENPYPIPSRKVAVVHGQGQFHPAKYIVGLAAAFEKMGGIIQSNTRVLDTDAGSDEIRVHTSGGDFMATHVIWATHTAPGVNILHFRNAPYRSYVAAFELNNDQYPDPLGYDMADPYHYYRTHVIDGKKYLIAGGEDHKTGHEENTEACFSKLESYVRTYFDVKEMAFKWSSQYFEPADGLAYIGHLPGNDKHIYVATGYGGNGMTYSHVAALLFRDLVIDGDSEYKDLFSPGRIKPIAGFENFIKESADVVKEWIQGKFSSDKISELAELAAGEAKVVTYEGKKLALYKDEAHNMHAVNPTCTHVHCTVAWNDTERSWDCPCHGARYDADGQVITGPAVKNLEKWDVNLDV